MGLAICFKSEYEGIFVVVAVSVTSKIKIEGEKEACNSGEGHDKEKIRVVVESGKRDPDGISLLCQMEATSRRINGNDQYLQGSSG